MDAIAAPKPKVLFETDPFIPYLREQDFDTRLKSVAEPYKKRMGFLPNALKLYAYRPEIAETLLKLPSMVRRPHGTSGFGRREARLSPAAFRSAMKIWLRMNSRSDLIKLTMCVLPLCLV